MVKKRIYYFLPIIVFIFLNYALVVNVFAYDCCCTDGSTLKTADKTTCDTECSKKPPVNGTTVRSTECPTENKNQNSSSVTLQDPLGLNGNVEGLFVRIIKVLLGLVGIASLVAFVYAGFMFLISAGSSERVKKAKDTMVYAVLGIFISMAAYVILSFVFKALEGSL